MIQIDSQVSYGKKLPEFTQEQIKNEPMFFNADREFCMKEGGPITRAFFEALPKSLKDKHVVFDSRVHMLMQGWYPCIPGYHHDDVPRGTDGKGQPNYKDPQYRSKHALALVGGDICPTQFAIGNTDFEVPEEGEIVYKKWHLEVLNKIKEGKLFTVTAPDRQIVLFDDRTWHEGTRANGGGFRWFGRVSWDTDRVWNTTNEKRTQVQVYLEFPMEGW